MKKLVCELCGDINLVKTDGLFVCQSCGCKYTIEEARKMMIDGTVDVTGTVKVDRSSEIENILKNADTTFGDGNYKEAFDLYSQTLNIDPDNPHAIIYRAMSSAWQSTVKDCKINEINNAAERAFKLQHDIYGDKKEYFDFCFDATSKIAPLINAIANMYITYHNKAMPRNVSITGAIATAGIGAEVKKTMNLGTALCCFVSKNVVNNVLNNVVDYGDSKEELWTVLHNMANNCIIYRKNAKMPDDPEAKTFLDEIDGLKKTALNAIESKEQEKIDAYWSEHPEVKKELDDKLTNARSQKDVLENVLTSIPELEQKRRIEGEIASLEKEMNSLGMFKGKEKKALQAKIDVLKEEKGPLDNIVAEKQKSLQSQINELIDVIKNVEEELKKTN